MQDASRNEHDGFAHPLFHAKSISSTSNPLSAHEILARQFISITLVDQ